MDEKKERIGDKTDPLTEAECMLNGQTNRFTKLLVERINHLADRVEILEKRTIRTVVKVDR